MTRASIIKFKISIIFKIGTWSNDIHPFWFINTITGAVDFFFSLIIIKLFNILCTFNFSFEKIWTVFRIKKANKCLDPRRTFIFYIRYISPVRKMKQKRSLAKFFFKRSCSLCITPSYYRYFTRPAQKSIKGRIVIFISMYIFIKNSISCQIKCSLFKNT